MGQGWAVEQAVARAVGSGKGPVQGTVLCRGVALSLGGEQDLAIQMIHQASRQVVAEAVQDGATGAQATQQPAGRDRLAAVGKPLGRGQAACVGFKQDESKQQIGWMERTANAGVGFQQGFKVELLNQETKAAS